MGSALELYLIAFISVTIVLLIILAAFLIKLLLEVSKLVNNLSDITTVIKSDLEPTVKELQITLKSINSIVKQADQKVSDIKGVAAKVLGAGALAVNSLKGLTGSFWKGMSAGLKLFKK
ncbi:MAG: hypothetical protein K6C94_03760 [Candidatus Gastranaerophilales bacterium]|nr:hypothetical protein [Candidatus Gastranaerophilales bacterium]